ncbi:PREDICTED: NADH dehydrogenase [ubiquinone] 1 beta subcomplex subunit 4 [Pygoscelis adeliae]|nr:PREDICTED: NADH dehydrogenase [ubiquinone] 1 beta subcomplex subunit 4 [Pygoscelis adeliae]
MTKRKPSTNGKNNSLMSRTAIFKIFFVEVGWALQGARGLTVVFFPTQEDPALVRWAYARTQNVYPTFRPTPKTSFLGALFAIGPILFWAAVFKADRDRKEKLIQEGKYKRPFSLF